MRENWMSSTINEELIRNKKLFYTFVVQNFNARLVMGKGNDYMTRKFWMWKWNKNGDRLVGIIPAARLFHGKLFFGNKENCRWTRESSKGMTHDVGIDHVFTSKKWYVWLPKNLLLVPNLSHLLEKNVQTFPSPLKGCSRRGYWSLITLSHS